MLIQFDDAAADALIRAAESAARELRGQGPVRSAAVTDAVRDFSGGYSQLFMSAAGIEAEDRVKLAGVLEDLAELAWVAKQRAAEERERLEKLAAWEEREAERAAIPGGLLPDAPYDPKPSGYCSVPPGMGPLFGSRERLRVSGAAQHQSGTTSADPELLRGFAAHMRSLNSVLEGELNAVRNAWAVFVASCSWVPIGTATFVHGFERLLEENHADITWAEGLAGAFEAAGSGTLPNAEVSIAVAASKPQDLQELLLDGGLSPEHVAKAWATLTSLPGFDTEAFLRNHAGVLGALDGIPAMARVQANRHRAEKLLKAAEIDLEKAPEGMHNGWEDRADFLRNEVAYLKKVVAGEVQLYLYDRKNSRIIEMIGAPGPDTLRTVTYVPGTFTGMNSFYTGGVQQISKRLTARLPGTVAFVYKDGLFPGEEHGTSSPDFARIGEANDPARARTAGKQLADFGAGMRADPALGGVKHVGIGHSWGLANITSSETAGTHYDLVLSLSGAGMLPEWEPDTGTGYYDLSYRDILQNAQRDGHVWEKKYPRNHPGFTSLPYYEGPDDDVLRSTSVWESGNRFGKLTDNHNLIATDSKHNKDALDDMVDLIR